MAYRNKVHTSTNFTPYELLFGRKMNGFDKIEIGFNEDEELSLLRRQAEIKKSLEETIPKAKEYLEKSQEKQIVTQNKQKKVTFETLNRDDEVYIRSEKIQNKFEPLFSGPYYVKELTENGNYRLVNQKGEEIKESYPRWRLKFAKPEVKDEKLNLKDSLKDLGDDFHEVEKILDHKKVGRGFKYFVRLEKPSSFTK